MRLRFLPLGRRPLTYGLLSRHVADVVRALNALGVGRNDRVATVLPDGPEMAVAFMAIAAGATCAPLNPAYRAGEFESHLARLHCRALLVPAGCTSAGSGCGPGSWHSSPRTDSGARWGGGALHAAPRAGRMVRSLAT